MGGALATKHVISYWQCNAVVTLQFALKAMHLTIYTLLTRHTTNKTVHSSVGACCVGYKALIKEDCYSLLLISLALQYAYRK